MLAITTIGLNIAKSVFQVHGVDAQGSVVVRRQLKRPIRTCILQEAVALPSGDRGLCDVASLVTRAAGPRA